MKVLSPAVTCLLTSHMKPYLRDSLNSLLAQTRQDFHVVVIDSGQWIGQDDPRSKDMAAVYVDFAAHPLIEWVTTGERPGLAQRRCPVAWAANEAIRAGLVRGRYVCTFYDDDVYRPRFMEAMAGFLDDHPEHQAVWCSQHRVRLTAAGPEPAGQIIAYGPKHGAEFDCQVDGAQVMFRREILDAMGDPWLDENPDAGNCRHSDGIFLNRLGEIAGTVPAVAEVLCEHRFTPLSTYTPC